MARVACVFSVEDYESVERPLSAWGKAPFGLSLVAACLEAAGHEVRCWVICPATDLEKCAAEMVDEFRCDIVAPTTVTTQFPLIVQLCEQIKLCNPKVKTLVGGAHPSLNPQGTIAEESIDAICLGEGEQSAVAYADAISRQEQPLGIPGLWVKLDDRSVIERTPPLPFNLDLDSLPLVNLDHWARWVKEGDHNFRVVIGRGCPFSCTYCSNHALRTVTSGKYVRYRSPDNVMREIERLVERFPAITELYLEVETIGSIPAAAIALCEEIAKFNAKREKPIAFRANLAVTSNLVKNSEQLHALLSAFQRANLTCLNVGLESGSERIRKEILNRPGYTNADLITFCKVAKQYGIDVVLYVLIGLPTETTKDFLETASVARACKPVDIYESIFYPYLGTKLCQLAQEMKLFDPSAISTKAERVHPYLELKGFPRWRICFEYVFITWRVFHGRMQFSRLRQDMTQKTWHMFPGVRNTIRDFRHALFGHSPARS